jgi:hypothetical protein
MRTPRKKIAMLNTATTSRSIHSGSTPRPSPYWPRNEITASPRNHGSIQASATGSSGGFSTGRLTAYDTPKIT